MKNREGPTERVETFSDRLSLVVDSFKSVNEFAKFCGIAESVVRAYLAGKSLPGLDKLLAISRVGGVKIEWLATGNGPMKEDAPPHEDRRSRIIATLRAMHQTSDPDTKFLISCNINVFTIIENTLEENQSFPPHLRPNAIFFAGLSSFHIESFATTISAYAKLKGKNLLLIDADGKTLIQLMQSFSSRKHRTGYEAFEEYIRYVDSNSSMVIFKNISKIRGDHDKGGLATTIIKSWHASKNRANIDLIFIDHVDFLKNSWNQIELYVIHNIVLPNTMRPLIP